MEECTLLIASDRTSVRPISVQYEYEYSTAVTDSQYLSSVVPDSQYRTIDSSTVERGGGDDWGRYE